MQKLEKYRKLSISVKNVGGIKDFSVEGLMPGTYIVEGENASGKTSFIEAFLALCDIEDKNRRLIYKNRVLGSIDILYNETMYKFPVPQKQSLLTHNKYIENVAFCNSANQILNAMLNGMDDNDSFLRKKLTEIVGYDAYNKISSILITMIETYSIQIEQFRKEISEFNLDTLSSDIIKTRKEIKEYKNLAEEYSYITDLVREKEKEIQQLEDTVASLDKIQGSIESGDVFTFQEEYIRKNMGLSNLKEESERIKSKFSQFGEHMKEYQKKSNLFSKQLETLEKNLEKHGAKKARYTAANQSILEKISEFTTMFKRYEELLTLSACPYCLSETEQHKVRFEQELDFLNTTIVSLRKTYNNDVKELEKVSKQCDTQKMMIAEHLSQMNNNTSKLQDLQSFKQSNEIQLQDTERLIDKLTIIQEKIVSEFLEKQQEIIAAKQSLREICGSQYNDFLETMRESEAANTRLKQLEKNKKNVLSKKVGIKSLTEAGVKLNELKDKVDEIITDKIRETENQIESSLNRIVDELKWNIQKISFKDGKITVIRKGIEFPIDRLSKAESSSIILLTLYHLRKLVAPEFPLFFVDDIGFFDPVRQENFIKFINKDINEGKGTDFMFFTRPKSGVPLQVVKYE